MSLYYGNLFTAEAVSGGDKQVISLINETHVAAYGIYTNPRGGRGRPRLTHLAVLDKTPYDAGGGKVNIGQAEALLIAL